MKVTIMMQSFQVLGKSLILDIHERKRSKYLFSRRRPFPLKFWSSASFIVLISFMHREQVVLKSCGKVSIDTVYNNSEKQNSASNSHSCFLYAAEVLICNQQKWKKLEQQACVIHSAWWAIFCCSLVSLSLTSGDISQIFGMNWE